MKKIFIIILLLLLTGCNNYSNEKTLLYNGIGIEFTFYPIVGFRIGYFENILNTNNKNGSNTTIINK